MARIGIKLADGSFYPILEDEANRKKRLVLTVARDGQTSAQIDVLRQDEQAQQYVGCLVLEDLPAEGATELELVVSLDSQGNVEARVSDTAGAHYQSLAVNLGTLASTESFSLPDEDEGQSLGDVAGVNSLEEIGLPDFDEEGDEPFADEPLDYSTDDFPMGGDEDADVEEIVEPDPAPRPFSTLVLAAILLIGISTAFLGAFLVFRWLQTDPLPELRSAAVVPLMLWPRLRSERDS